jgi:hypothetical protein
MLVLIALDIVDRRWVNEDLDAVLVASAQHVGKLLTDFLRVLEVDNDVGVNQDLHVGCPVSTDESDRQHTRRIGVERN